MLGKNIFVNIASFLRIPQDELEANLGRDREEQREVLDIGRESRTPTAAQRRAVVARDRHCQYPDCRAPAHWCDVHHIVEWDDGGPTDLVNLVLLCRRHHVAVHEGRKRLIRNPDGSFSVTPGLRISRRSRHGQRARGDPDG